MYLGNAVLARVKFHHYLQVAYEVVLWPHKR
jgi:hypothetical protein